SSRPSRFNVFPQYSAICRPAVVEPVKEMPATRGSLTSGSPASAAFPVTKFSTPPGRPASSRISTSLVAMIGVSDAGLNTTVFPAISAGQLFLPLLDQEAGPQDDLATDGGRRPPPVRERLLGRAYGGIDVLGIGGLHHAQHPVLVRRVHRVEGPPGLRLHPAPADVVLVGLDLCSSFGLACCHLAHAATSWKAPCRISHASSSSSAERLSGGTSRRTLSCVPQLSRTRPESRLTLRTLSCRSWSGLPSGLTSSTPIISPSPRTSPMPGTRRCSS